MNVMRFETEFSLVWITVGALLLFFILVWLETKRKQKFYTLRLVALFIALLALTGLLTKPALKVHKTTNYIILTHNFDQHILDSLTEQHPTSQLYTLSDTLRHPKATTLKNYRDLSSLNGNIFLLGDGLPPYAIPYLDTSAFRYFPSTLPEGFTYIANQQQKYYIHKKNFITGSFNAYAKTYHLKLTGPSVTEDSVYVKPNTSTTFSLSFTPKTEGTVLYTLSAHDSSGNTVYHERVPLVVAPQKPLSILILNDYPTAETRFLKNYLEIDKHQIALRTGISKNKYRTAFVNMSKRNLDVLDAKRLGGFDLVIAPAATLASLTGQQQRELKQAVFNGLGLITLIDSDLSTNTKNFLSITTTAVKHDTARITVNTQKIKYPAKAITVTSQQKLVPILTEPSQRIITGYQSVGLGKIGFQLLTDTYRLQLAGNPELYAGIWADLLTQNAREALQNYSVQRKTPFPVYTDEPVAFDILSSESKPTLRLDSLDLPLMEDQEIQNLWHSNVWAGNEGWHTIEDTDGHREYTWFVCADSEWGAMRIAQQQSQLAKLSGSLKPATQHIVYQPVRPIVFYLAFLIAAGFLWLSPKL